MQIQMRQLKTGDLFAKAGELCTTEYYGNGWHGRPYSGGPWHVTADTDPLVERVEVQTLRQLLVDEQGEIHDSELLKDQLLNAARVLWTLGHRVAASTLFERVRSIPSKLSEEAINSVLMFAWSEVNETQVDVDQLPDFNWLSATTLG